MRLPFAKGVDRVLGGLLGRIVCAGDRLAEAIRPPAPVDEVRHVLLVKFWGLGNWALLRPVVRDLRQRRPGARFTIVTLASNTPMVDDLADRVLAVRSGGYAQTLRDLVRACRILRSDPPDLSLDFEQFARAGALLARLAGAKQRLGFRSGVPGRDGLSTVLVPFRADAHAARSFRDLAEAAGLPAGPYVPGHLAPTAAGARVATPFAGDSPYVVLHPGSGDNFPGRRWSPAGFSAVGRAAVGAGCRVVVTGTAAEAALAEEVARGVGAGAVAAAGRLPVQGLVALLAGARALVSNDTGPVHLASALAVPTLAFYGPNTPRMYGPLAPRSRALWRGLPCSPCLTVESYRSSRCRIFTCMESLATGEAVAALRALLDAPAVPRGPDAPARGEGSPACAVRPS